MQHSVRPDLGPNCLQNLSAGNKKRSLRVMLLLDQILLIRCLPKAVSENALDLITTGLQIRVRIGKLFSLFLIQNICCGYLKEPSQ